jgi:tRNA (pseudouridine54-N1)-methyltransferase
VTPDPKFNLNNLTGTGRLDVLCRTITSTFFLSNSFRKYSNLFIYFQATAQLTHFDGNFLKGLNPDERSIAGFLRRIFQNKKIQGVTTRLISLEDFRATYPKGFILNSQGMSFNKVNHEIQDSQIFFLGDHIGFNPEEKQILSYLKPLSLGPNMLLTSHCITILHHLLDSLE